MTLALGQRVHAGVALSPCCRPRLQTQPVCHHRHAPLKAQRSFNRSIDVRALRHSASAHQSSKRVRCRSSTRPVADAAASTPPAKCQWGADMKNLGISVGLAAAVWFLPSPAGVTGEAWHLLAIFLGTISKADPLVAVAMLGLGATMLTKTLTFPQAFSAFASEIP